MSSIRTRLQALSSEERGRYEALVDSFEKGWQNCPDDPPDVATHLPSGEPLRTLVLVALVQSDMEARWRRQTPLRAGDYLSRFAELAKDRHAAAEVLAWEYRLTPSPAASPAAPDVAGRNRLRDEIGSGGIGIVFRGQDPQLDRELAVKILRPSHADNAGLVCRFLEEARILGRLQHPGVVPVYDSGQLTDGRPYFTMRLVHGRTLASLLAERSDSRQGEPRFLAIFEQICQTLAYAHKKGIVHRDLKPANVMVGAFGEVQVMDWGLAKVLPPVAQAGRLCLGSEQAGRLLYEADGHTAVGSVLGTPAYMAPEQARGEVEEVNERADVFSLGALLCVVLTGKPPYEGPSREVLDRARRGDLAEGLARLEDCGAHAELVRLCRDCLAPRREDRPADAGAVAARLATYQEVVRAEQAAAQERLQQAEIQRAQAEVKAEEEQKRRLVERQKLRVTLGLAAALMVALGLGSAGGVWLEQDRLARLARQERAGDRAEMLIEQATQARKRMRWDDAKLLLKQAREAVKDAKSDGLQEKHQQAEAALTLAEDLDRVRENAHALIVDGKWNPNLVKDRYPPVFKSHGLDVLAEPIETLAQHIRASPVRDEILAALDDWTQYANEGTQRRLLELTWRVDPVQHWRKQLLQPGVLRNPEWRRALLGQIKQERLPPATAVFLSWFLGRGTPEAQKLLERVRERNPHDFWLNFTLGYTLAARDEYLEERDRSRQAEAIGYYRAALAVKPESSATHNNLAAELLARGDVEGSIRSCQEAIRFDPRLAQAHSSLGNALLTSGDVEGAIRSHREAIRLYPRLAQFHTNLGNALRANKDVEGAILSHREAIRLNPSLAGAHYNLGNALYASKDLKGAIGSYREAIRLKPDYEWAHLNLGAVLDKQGKWEEAVKEYRAALKARPNFPVAHYNIGNALRKQGKLHDAVTEYRAALKAKPGYPDAHLNLGVVLFKQRDWVAAEAECRAALKIRPGWPEAHNHLGSALREQQGKVAEAVVEHQTAIKNRPDFPEAHNNLGLALAKQGQLARAEAAYREAIRIKKDYVEAHLNLGSLLHSQGRLASAEALYREVIRLKKDDYSLHYNLGNALYGQGRWKEAEVAHRTAIGHKQDYAEAHCNLGFSLLKQDRFPEALSALRRGHELGSKQPRWLYPSAQWVRHVERLVELDTKRADVQNGRARPRDAAEQLALADFCQGHKRLYATAAHFYADAFAAPKLANEMRLRHRYNAACAAALAGTGQGKDTGNLDDTARAEMRYRALSWLHDDLGAHAQQLSSLQPVTAEQMRRTLLHWHKDPDLAAVRDPASLVKLPEAEQVAWRNLWVQVDALLARIGPGK